MVVNIIRICDGFLTVGPSLPGGPVQYFNDISQRTFLIKSCLFNTQTLILDAVVVSSTMSGAAMFCSKDDVILYPLIVDLSSLHRLEQ